MNRFYLFSLLLHTTLFSTLGITTKIRLKSRPEIKIYRVNIAPLPQLKVKRRLETPSNPESDKKTERKKSEGKSAPEKKNDKKVNRRKELPDISPQIYTGSGRGFNYSYYLNILLNKIGENWNNPYKNKDVILKSVVYFEVDENGLISNIRIENDSGDEIYNESTIRAVVLTKKLPPLPQEFSDDYLKVHLEFLTAR